MLDIITLGSDTPSRLKSCPEVPIMLLRSRYSGMIAADRVYLKIEKWEKEKGPDRWRWGYFRRKHIPLTIFKFQCSLFVHMLT